MYLLGHDFSALLSNKEEVVENVLGSSRELGAKLGILQHVNVVTTCSLLIGIPGMFTPTKRVKIGNAQRRK